MIGLSTIVERIPRKFIPGDRVRPTLEAAGGPGPGYFEGVVIGFSDSVDSWIVVKTPTGSGIVPPWGLELIP